MKKTVRNYLAELKSSVRNSNKTQRSSITKINYDTLQANNSRLQENHNT